MNDNHRNVYHNICRIKGNSALEEISSEYEDDECETRGKFPEIDVVFQDEHIIVIDKPAGMDSVRGLYSDNCILDYLEKNIDGLEGGLGVIHRLDRETSGLMVLAKNEDAQKNLSKQWAERSVEKLYLALVRGYVYPQEGIIEMPLSKTDKRSKPVTVDLRRGKQAVTEYRVINQFRDYALVEAKLHTGRMHQIRVHFSSRGFPLICDRHYGSKEPLFLSAFKKKYKHSNRKEERPLISRLGLHSYKLSFEHPDTGERMSFVKEPPKDFASALNQLKKFGC